MDNQMKCSSEEHKDINAISFCPECKIYMCNKCENLHSPLFKNHHSNKLIKDNEIFTGICKEKNHPMKLEFFCRNHNQLCCVACLCKIKAKGYGAHKDCDVYEIEKIKDEKKNKLKENIKCLEDLENKFNENINKLKDIFEKIEKDKDDLKLKIQKIFTKIRNAINDREIQLLLKVDNLYNNNYFNEDIIKKGEKLPKKIKSSLERGKLLDKEWDNNNLISYINDCINIEKNIKDINIINENINKCNTNNKIKPNFFPKEAELNIFVEQLNSFGKISYYEYRFRECPEKISEERAYLITGKNKNIFTKTGKDTCWAGTICEYELDKSIEEHKWKIKILKTKNKNISIGVAPIDFDIHSSNDTNCGWYLYCSNLSLFSGPPFNYNGKNSNLSKINEK